MNTNTDAPEQMYADQTQWRASLPYGGNCPDGCGNLFGYFGLTLGARVGP